jgi:hypothetical protein
VKINPPTISVKEKAIALGISLDMSDEEYISLQIDLA